MARNFQQGSFSEFVTFRKGHSSHFQAKPKETSPSREKTQAHSPHSALERGVEEWAINGFPDHWREPTFPAGLPCFKSRESRSPSISSDRLPRTGFAEFLCPPATPDPAFIAISAACQIVTREHDNEANFWSDGHWLEPYEKTVLIAPSMLELVNRFLDQLLFDILSISKSTAIGTLRSAVTEVLKPKLAKDTISDANQELHEYLGDSEVECPELESSSGWNLELIWKQIRLRCMVYSSLGAMDETDEECYTEQGQLRMASPAAAIFLISILEHIGELILIIVAKAAYRRSHPIHEQEENTYPMSKFDGRIIVEKSDLERVALDRSLGRLWRKFNKRINLVTSSTTFRDKSSNKSKILTKWQKAFQATPLWDPHDTWKETTVHNKLTPLEEKHWEDAISMIRQIRKTDHFFLTIHDVYFGGIWFNKEVLRMIGRTRNFFLSVAWVYPHAESITRTLDAAEEPASPDSEHHTNDDGTTESEESYDSTSSVTQDVVDESLIQPLIVASKQKLIDGLMEHFWALLEKMQNTNIVSHASNANSAGAKAASSSTALSTELSSLKGSKKRLSNDSGADSEEGEQNRYNPPGKGSAVSDQTKSHQGFACPYRKHNPRKYNIDGWRPCALTPHNTIARVKGHLYRHHRIFQCPRCKELFCSQDEMDAHFIALQGCDLSSEEAIKGITTNIEKYLRSRKKKYRHQTEEDRWGEIYRILFPGENIPSPYFEPIQEESDHTVEYQALANYEDYSRRELPRLFRSVLETAIDNQAQPIEEQMRQQLTSMIQSCQARIFADYRALHVRSSASPQKSSESEFNSPSRNKETEVVPGNQTNPVKAVLRPEIRSVKLQSHGPQQCRDSGYGSHHSASGSPINEELGKAGSNNSTASDFQFQVSTLDAGTTLIPGSLSTPSNVRGETGHGMEGPEFSLMDGGISGFNDQELLDQDFLDWEPWDGPNN